MSKVATLSEAFLSYSSSGGWIRTERGAGFGRLLQSCGRTRGFGDFWSYMLLAEGSVDVAAEPELSLHDMAAPSIIVEEAGGRFTDLDGSPGPYGGNALATNSLLHDEVLGLLGD